ncbi:MAG: helix-turn-helix transcriptional regulator [Defluviitaleaceae bacterium]|nr:helix-turn-helix transcriptional regulator [Defluviitaleaceae bacterium]
MPESFEKGALTEATFLILTSLQAPRHGYGVMRRVADETGGRVNLGAGTLYGAIGLLLEKGWIRGAPENPDRKKVYESTDEGTGVMLREMYRLRELLEIGGRALAESGQDGKGGALQ